MIAIELQRTRAIMKAARKKARLGRRAGAPAMSHVYVMFASPHEVLVASQTR